MDKVEYSEFINHPLWRKKREEVFRAYRTSPGSHLNRLSENANYEKFCIDNKGLMTRRTTKIPILGQPVNY